MNRLGRLVIHLCGGTIVNRAPPLACTVAEVLSPSPVSYSTFTK